MWVILSDFSTGSFEFVQFPMEHNFSLKDILFFKQRKKDHVSHIFAKYDMYESLSDKNTCAVYGKNVFQKW